jgi:hypothetical protein
VIRPRLRLRVRTLLVLVALAALVSSAEAARRRRALFGRLAAYHARREWFYTGMEAYTRADSERRAALWRRDYVHRHPDRPVPHLSQRGDAGLLLDLARRIGYHDSLRRKYEHAAAHPWLSPAPDPPPPPVAVEQDPPDPGPPR